MHFETAEELLQHYAAVKARLRDAALKRPQNRQYDFPIGPLPEVITKPNRKSILREVAAEHGMAVEDICGTSRKRKHVLARRVLYFRLKEELNMSFAEIGRFIGRDHTSVLFGYRQYVANNPGSDYVNRRMTMAEDCVQVKILMANFKNPKFKPGDRVRKIKGSSWQGLVVGAYSASLTPEGYAVESEREPGNVQVYPAAALEFVPN